MDDDTRAAPTLGRYQIEAELGRGTMGVVYCALDPDLGRRVALKTIHAALGQTEDERTAFEKRFLSEARAAAGLQHPGIVVVHDVGRDARTGVLYMALEHLAGRTLQALLAAGQPLPWPEAARVCARVAEALQHAHERGIIHRDVKPANIMVLPSGEPKVMDFGIARLERSDLTLPGEAFGTPLYMSPEQAQGAPLDARSDVFSLGAVLYEALTGRRAFDAPGLPAILTRVAQSEPVPPSHVVTLPAALDDVVARALAKSTALRYPDARALAEDLDDVRAGQPPRHLVDWIRPAPRSTEGAPRPDAEPATVELRSAAEPTTLRARFGGRRAVAGLLIAAAVGVAGFLARQASRTGSVLPDVSLPASLATPARLEVAFEHGLRQGVLRVLVDDEQVLEQPFEGRLAGKLLFVKKRRGSVTEALEVAPGERSVRVTVESSDGRWTARLAGAFESGRVRRLQARLTGGILGRGRDLELAWVDPAPAP